MKENNEFLEQILASQPSPTTVRLILSKFMQQGRYRHVIKYAVRGLRDNPYDVELMKILAEAYENAGFLGQAEDTLQRACSTLDYFSVLFKDLGKLYATRNRKEEARICIKKYLSHHPEDPDATELLEFLQKREEVCPPPEVEAPASQETPRLQDLATPTLAEIYFNQGQIQDAIEIYETVLERHPDDLEAARRLEELRTMAQGPADEEQPLDQHEETAVTARRARMIAILESWLGRIQEMNRAS